MRPYLILATLITIIAALAFGYQRGYAAANTAHALALAEAKLDAVKAAEIASRKEEERLKAEAERMALVQQLEDLAHAEPVSSAACLPASRVRRLNSY